MKNFKKMLSLILSVVMVLGLSVVTMAEDSYTITIKNAVNAHVYNVYQIFSGELAETDNGDIAWTDVQWGSGVDSAKVANINAADKADALNDGTLTAEVFATEADGYISTAAATATAVNNEAVITVLEKGYYLIKDANNENDVYILEVVNENTTVYTKTEKVPEFEKKLIDTNDSTGDTTGLQDSADYDIGDDVPFTLTATLPEDYNDYSKYTLVFHDTLSDGLTFNENSVNVKINDTELTEADYSVSTSTDGCSFDVKIGNLKDLGSFSAGDKVVVTYTAELNDNAVIGSAGNPNVAYLEYSNNPKYDVNNDSNTDNDEDTDGDGTPDIPVDDNGNEDTTGDTPEDKVIVFTYELQVNKVDQDNIALTGAGFTLYKYDNTTADYVQVGDEVKGEDLTTFSFTGIDDGKYKLSETTIPAGYNKADDIEFTVEATHDTESDDPKFGELVVKDADGNEISGDAAIFTIASDNSKIISTDVVNNKGAVLPETGGMGTRVIYALGGALVLVAAVLLITKRRMNNN